MITKYYKRFNENRDQPENTLPKISRLLNCLFNNHKWIMKVDEVENMYYILKTGKGSFENSYDLTENELKYLIETVLPPLHFYTNK